MTKVVARTSNPAALSLPVDMRADGLLWLINTVVFHPRGFALGTIAGSDGHEEWVLLGDGSERWRFAEDDGTPNDDRWAAVEALFARARTQRAERDGGN